MKTYKPPESSSDSDSDSDDGKKKRKKKKKKVVDPNKPKRPMSSYMLFTLDKRADIKKDFPEGYR